MHPLNAHVNGGSLGQTVLTIEAQVLPPLYEVCERLIFQMVGASELDHAHCLLSVIEPVQEFLLKLSQLST